MNIERTTAAIDDIRSGLRTLPDLLPPGTPLRWHQRDLSADQEARMDDQARAERDAKAINIAAGITSLGTGRAPLRLDILDVIADLEASTADLEAAACGRLGLDTRAATTTDQRLDDLRVLLGRIAEDDDLADHVDDEVHRIRRQVRRALGDHEPVARLDVRCPVCRARSIRALLEQELFVCVNAACRCGDDTCPCDAIARPRRHCWSFTEWPELAGQFNAEQTGGGDE